MKLIPLTRGQFAMVDDEDYAKLSQFKWSFLSVGYACRGVKNNRTILMHRQIMNPREDQEVDHRDRNGLNNTKANLRVCSHAENLRNHKLNSQNKTGFRGVSFEKTRRKYFASIRINGKTKFLGRFDTAEKASLARDTHARKVWGNFASVSSL